MFIESEHILKTLFIDIVNDLFMLGYVQCRPQNSKQLVTGEATQREHSIDNTAGIKIDCEEIAKSLLPAKRKLNPRMLESYARQIRFGSIC